MHACMDTNKLPANNAPSSAAIAYKSNNNEVNNRFSRPESNINSEAVLSESTRYLYLTRPSLLGY